ncbi:MAG TPA: DUF86 domain-containing protein [Leptospiraceae bacterium]|nr:DUF86 domain-containing protein [Leptospiraceae bacterium]HNF13751.1 DUF86 domain-containing protein [Leptospiraceae bacterium]HNN06465.1 DUF86 domain-containing protein [Leptospiraceae bacterium]
MRESDEIRIRHILDAILEIESFTKEISIRNFEENRMIRNATVRSLEIIGEAVGALSEEFKTLHSEIPWQDWKDFRNVLIHQYFGIDYQMVYNSLIKDMPVLKSKVAEILNIL